MLTLTTDQPTRHPDPTSKATRLACLLFERPDLDRAERFLTDFGLISVHRDEHSLSLRGSMAEALCYRVRRGPVARFIGLAFDVASRAELEALSALPEASSIEESGADTVVRLTDPSGFEVQAVLGREAGEVLENRAALVLNTGDATPRVNRGQRVPVGAPVVRKLGHVVLEVPRFQETCAWYTRHFGLIPSDILLLPDGSPMIVFLRLDLGDRPADHHSLSLGQGIVPAFSHAAFELSDPDALGMGQHVMHQGGHRHAWGIGRHLLGSQVFDYWDDPWHAHHEHYCDGDVFTADQPAGVSAVHKDGLYQWAPPLPPAFLRPKISPRFLVDAVRSIRRSPDLSFGKVFRMARALL